MYINVVIKIMYEYIIYGQTSLMCHYVYYNVYMYTIGPWLITFRSSVCPYILCSSSIIACSVFVLCDIIMCNKASFGHNLIDSVLYSTYMCILWLIIILSHVMPCMLNRVHCDSLPFIYIFFWYTYIMIMYVIVVALSYLHWYHTHLHRLLWLWPQIPLY